MRWGALSRYIWLRIVYSEESMTQRELDMIYMEQVIRFGREVRNAYCFSLILRENMTETSQFFVYFQYPNLLLVSGICFTYACIAPVVLPAG